MRYISLFSGVEAATLAWEPLGWEPVAFAEIEPFPSAVLAERFPEVPNLGDITKVDWSEYRGAADIVVGGFPCQSYSIAGLRKGLLTLEETSCWNSSRLVERLTPSGSSARTCQAFYPLTEGGISRPSSKRWQSSGLGGHLLEDTGLSIHASGRLRQ